MLDPSSSPPDGLIELKNPSTAKDMTIKEASEKIKGFCIKSNQGQNALDTNHDYFLPSAMSASIAHKLHGVTLS